MNTNEFDYQLDDKFIAQHPEAKRENCKLMIVDKKEGSIENKRFFNIIEYLNPGDTLVLNDTKVLPARLFGHRKDREESIEVLILKNTKGNIWNCLVKPGKKMKLGTRVYFGDLLEAEVIDILEDGQRVVEFFYEGIFEEILDQLGSMPLPPYITEKLEDKSQYQTVYAKHNGSAAAPTAGLHFSKELLSEIEKKGINIAYVTLHVGLGTFRPVKVEDVTKHKMHSEFIQINQETADLINATKAKGKKIVAVGTTSVRTLESVYDKLGKLEEYSGWTEIFIYPGFEFKVIDSLITNFHLPKSTLLMLVSALSSKKIMLNAYEEAKKNDYRFFSFGDAMLIK